MEKHEAAILSLDPGEIAAMVATYREYNHANHDAMVRRYPQLLEAVKVTESWVQLAALGVQFDAPPVTPR